MTAVVQGVGVEGEGVISGDEKVGDPIVFQAMRSWDK
jgi:hypothetical protein